MDDIAADLDVGRIDAGFDRFEDRFGFGEGEGAARGFREVVGGKASWDIDPATPFLKSGTEPSVTAGRRKPDSGFAPSRWESAPRSYLRAMALDGDSGSSTGALAERLGVSASKLGPARAAVIAKGLVYAPEQGYVAFTVPGMASFILRQQDDSR